MHELYRVLSAISADTFSQHFRTYFIIPCNPMIYKHLKLLRRPEWNTDIRTVLARQGLNIQKKRHPSDDSFFYLFESTRRRRTSGGRSTATTAAERRHSDRSNPAGLEHTKKEISNGYLLFCIIESTRRDSNSTNIGKATKIKEERTLSTVCLQAVYNLEIREESCQGVCGADTFYPFTACYRG